jgi:thioredoxin reductase (NADPH)
MRIVNPAFGQSVPEGEQTAARPVDWGQDAIILFSNSKPNARELLEGIRDQMAAFRSTDNVDFTYKDSAAQPAPAEMIDTLSKEYSAAILGVAD